MTSRQRWAFVWGAWISYLIVAESVALASDEPSAPLCGVLRPILGARKGNAHTVVGAVGYAAGAAWFAVHLFGKEGSA